MLFKYRVKDKQGKITTGTVEARSSDDAVKLLRERGFFIVNITETKIKQSVENLSTRFSRVSFTDIVNFTRQLSTMVNAGLPLVDSLDLLTTQTKNSALRVVLAKLLKKIEGGGSLGDALSEHPKYFNKIYTSLVHAGESSGKLDVVLTRLSDNLEKERVFRGKIKGAMVYPTIIFIGMIAVVFLMMTFVIPKMTLMYKEFNVELPLPTQILMATSDIFVKFWWLILAVLVGFYYLFSSWKKSKSGRKILDKITLILPIWGPLKKETILVELTRTLGLLVGAGVSILEALGIIAEAVESDSYAKGVREATTKVEKGFPLGVTLSNNPIFPALLGQMISVGEETGKLDETLMRVSQFFEASASEKVKALTTAIEPLIMVVLGVGVGFLILSIVLPMYKLTEAFQ